MSAEHGEQAFRSELSKALHHERAEANTRNVDCWACEVVQSQTIANLAARVVLAEARAAHVEAVLRRAVPDEADQLALWQDHWHEQITPALTQESDQ
jgi:hypothetical protein